MARRNAYKIARLVICCFVFAMVLTGCRSWFESEPFTYSFRQERENIVKVEICGYDVKKVPGVNRLTPLAELTNREIDAILVEIQAVDCYKVFLGDDVRDYGEVVVAITYLDGEIELIGLMNIGYFKPNGRGMMESYKFQPEGIRAVIGKYVDLDAYFEQKKAENSTKS